MNRAATDGFSPVPSSRWDHSLFFSDSRRAPDKSYAPKGGFIDDILSFPALELGIPPRRVQVMDPQQRLLLWTALEAIEDAGISASDLPDRTGVIIGVTATEFREIQSARSMAQLMASGQFGTPPEDTAALSRSVERVMPPRAYSAAGALGNMTAAMVAQELDLKGPAYTVDSACASALVALSQAIDGLRSGTLDAALAGGVYLQLAPDHYLAFSRIGAISGKGACRPFDAEADGFVQGDGSGVVLLKRLDDAIANGDRIYAVIDGVALNSDGSGAGPMAPNVEGQADVIARAWADSGRDPSTLGYVEAHGTGTAVGDPTEIRGLMAAIGDNVTEAYLGSSKANVGHTMSAAGAAGVIRAALAIFHGERPPMAGFETANPSLELSSTPFQISTKPVAWDTDSRTACVSSFGFGGTNGHVVMSNPEPQPAVSAESQLELVVMSAADLDALRGLAERTADAIVADPKSTVAGVARAWARRRPLKARVGIVANGREDLIGKLRQVAAGDIPEGAHLGVPEGEPSIAFLYPGQGAQRPGMLADIRKRFPQVAATLKTMEQALDGVLERPLQSLIYPETVDDAATALLTQTSHCQPALLACGVALTQLLDDLGVKPTVTTGHSLGEFTAAVAAGVVSASDAAKFVARRGQAMEALGGDPGTMAALKTDAKTAQGLLVDGVVVANLNHPVQCVVSGTTEGVKAVVARAEAAGVEAIPLSVSNGFHSEVLSALDVGSLVDAITFHEPTEGQPKVASAIDAGTYRDAAHAKDVFKRHALSPVNFMEALEACDAEGVDIYLQVASGGPLAAFTRATLKGRGKPILSLAPMIDNDGGEALLSNLARLWTLGVNLDVRAIAGIAPIATLPPSVLPTERYWIVGDGGRAPTIEATKAASQNVTAQASATSAPKTAVQPASTANDAEGDDTGPRVMAIIAKVSAYPLAALKPSLTLMGALGFDSLMVADLATGLADAFDNVDGIPQELMLNNPTVEDVIDYVRTAVPGMAGGNDGPLQSWGSQWVNRERLGGSMSPPEVTSVAFVGGTSPELRQRFESAGAVVTSHPLGEALPASPDVLVFFGEQEAPKPLGAVLANEVAWPDRSGELITVLDALAAANAETDLIVIRRDDDPWAESLAGVARVVAREWPSRTAKVLTGASADQLLEEWGSADLTVDVRWQHNTRQTLRFAALSDTQLAGQPWVPSADETILITGGTRGIGAKLAERFADAGAKVVLLGRSAPSASVQAFIDGSKGRVTLAKADVTDLASVDAAVAPHGPITALVHAAGLLADGALGTVEPSRGEAARNVKARGFLNAVSACGKSLKVVLGIGSWAGRFGNRHQAHYAAGNALMSSLCQRPANGMRLVAAEFGPWAESDMVASIPEAIQAAMRAEGVDFISDAEGLDAIVADMADASGPVVHARRRPNVLRADYPLSLSVATHPYLADHAIDGTPVLPLAGAADLLSWIGGAQAASHGAFEISGLQLFKGVALTPADAVLPLRLLADGDKVEIRQGTDGTLSYRARLSEITEVAAIEPPERLTGGEAPTLSLAEFYADVTFHGPLLQGATRIDGIGEQFIRGAVKAGTPADWETNPARESFSVDPLALDSAMQLAAHVAWTRFGRAGTPVGLGRFIQLAPLETEVVTEVHFGDIDADSDRFSATIAFYGASNQLLALAEDVVAELRQIAGETAAEAEADTEAIVETKAPFEIKPEWVDPSRWREVKDMAMRLKMAEVMGVGNPYFHVHDGTARDTTKVCGQELVNFSSYNYLGLSGDKRVIEDVKVAVETFGTSVSASRVASGERAFHGELEKMLAECQGVEDTLLFTAGHAANVSTVGHLMGPRDLIVHDELIHDSLLGGIKMSGAARRGFKHEDHADLDAQLKELRPHYEKVLIIAEGVYSMDGDICNLPALVDVKKRHGCLLMIDEAHSFGVVGEHGFGVCEHWGIDGSEVDLWMGTLSKSLASCGGWIGGSQVLLDYLRYTVGGFVFSAGMTPANSIAALSSLKLMLAEPERVKELQSNAAFFHAECVKNGLDTGPARGGSGVIPVITGNSIHALFMSKYLAAKGINVQPIVFPAVADDASRLRFFLSSTHSEQQLAWTAKTVAETLAETREKHPVKRGKGSV